LDAYGHTYIYCRWENPRSSPAAPAFVLLSAGPNGKLETRCGDSSAQGDDGYLAMSVGVAINRAALWQANGSSNVTYGATGTQVVIDNSGDITAAGTLSALSAAITDGITASTLTTSGNILSSGNVTGNNINATGNVNGDSGSFGSLSGSSLNISGTAMVVGTATLGSLSAGASSLNSLAVSGNASMNNGLSVQSGDIVLANGDSYAQLDNNGIARHLIDLNAINDIVIGSSTGNILFYAGNAEAGWFDTSGDFTAFGTVNGQNGSFGNLSAGATTLNGALTGTSATFSGTVIGTSGIFTTLNSTNFITTNATVTGTLTANNFTLSGTATAGTGNFTNLNVTNLTASNNITAGGTVSGANITATGTVSGATGSFGSLGATSLTVTGNELVAGNLQVQGVSSLNSTGIGIGSASPVNLLDIGANGGIHIAAGTPSNTNYALYNVGGSLYWNGMPVGTSGGSGFGTVNVGTQYQMAYYAANGSALSGDSAIITDSGNDLLVKSGKIGIGSTAPVNTLDVTGTGIHIASGTPAATTYQLYNSGGTLYWNGSAIGSGGGSGSVNSGSAGQVAYYPNNGTAVIGTSTIEIVGGNVGIGVANPKQALDIYSGGEFIRGPRVVPSSGAGLVLDYGGMGGTGVAGIEAYDYGAGNPLNLTLEPFGGYIGIGTPQPGDALDVESGNIAFAYGNGITVSPTDTTFVTHNLINIVYTGSNDVVSYYTPGANRSTPVEVMLSNGRVGIGSTNPANTLDVTGTGIHIASGTPSGTTYQLYNNGGTLYWNGSAVSSGGGSNGTGSTGYDAIWTSATTIGTGLLYESAGYVGIGTAIPNATLEIYDNGDGIILSMAGFQQGATQYYDTDAYSYIDADTAGTGGLFLEGLSNSRTESGINMDGTVADTVLNPGQPAIKLSGEKRSGTGLTSLANNELILDVENFWNGPLFDVNGGGYVGIGTAAPQVTLDVNGVMRLAAQTAAPLTCSSTIKGTVAMTTHNGLCFCNGSAWEKVESPTTACAW
jgi:fibronectin-binding autotransporter adhesin